MKKIISLGNMLLIGLFVVLSQNSSVAQETKKGHSHSTAEMHGGSVAMSKQYHFEVVFNSDAIQVYLYDGLQKPFSAKGVEGEVTLKFKNGAAKKLPLKYASMDHEMKDMQKETEHEEGEHEEDEDDHDDHHSKKNMDHHGMSMNMDYLQANVDLGKVEAGTMKAVFSLKGLPNEKEREATFTETFNGFSSKEPSHHENKEHHETKGAHKH